LLTQLFFPHISNERVLGVSGIVSEDDVKKANDKIMKELENIVSNGFSQSTIQAALHKLEFKVRNDYENFKGKDV
jgi:Zn-dependent M16 (insulinase) family peptidase